MGYWEDLEDQMATQEPEYTVSSTPTYSLGQSSSSNVPQGQFPEPTPPYDYGAQGETYAPSYSTPSSGGGDDYSDWGVVPSESQLSGQVAQPTQVGVPEPTPRRVPQAPSTATSRRASDLRPIRTTGRTEYEGEAPEYAPVEYDKSRIAAIAQERAAPGLRRAQEGLLQLITGIRTSSANPNVRAMEYRQAMQGYGTGISQVHGTARAGAVGEYGQEYQAEESGRRAEYEADWRRYASTGTQIQETEYGTGREGKTYVAGHGWIDSANVETIQGSGSMAAGTYSPGLQRVRDPSTGEWGNYQRSY